MHYTYKRSYECYNSFSWSLYGMESMAAAYVCTSSVPQRYAESEKGEREKSLSANEYNKML